MGLPSPKFVGKVFSEFYAAPSHESARSLQLALYRGVVAAYHSFLMYTFSATVPVTVVELDLISSVVAAFTDGLTRGMLPLGIVDQCIEYILHEPRRLFSVCQMLAMGRNGDVVIRTRLVNLARLFPTHALWRERARYMSIEATYFLLDVEVLPDLELRRLEDRKKFALRVLDEFFV